MEKDPSVQLRSRQMLQAVGRMLLGLAPGEVEDTSPGLTNSVNDAVHGKVTPLPDTDWQLALQDMDKSINGRSK